jgi:hypothetical protein
MTSGQGLYYHKFVKTTPKPRATKNSNGDWVVFDWACCVTVGLGEALVSVVEASSVGAGIVGVSEFPKFRATISTISTITCSMIFIVTTFVYLGVE